MLSEGNAPKMETQQLVSPSQQCFSTPVGFGQGFFLTKNTVIALEHLPYSPDLTPADVYPSLRLKPALNGRRFVMLLTSLRMRRKS